MNRKKMLGIVTAALIAVFGTTSAFAASNPSSKSDEGTSTEAPDKPGSHEDGQGKPDRHPGGASSVNTGSGAYNLSDNEEIYGGTYSSVNEDESAILADNVTATLNAVNVEKTGDSSNTESSSFYGLNSGILAINKANLTINGGIINAAGKGANGVFAYNGAQIDISNTMVTADSPGAGGIEVAGGGIMNATNLVVKSTGKAAIRSDRGGGILNVNGGTYTSTGSDGAPAIYSTAAITVKNAALIAEKSRGIIIEGKNSVDLENCSLSGNFTTEEQNSSVPGDILIFQSMSGDAEVGTSVLNVKNSSLKAGHSAMFGISNTNSVINLEGVNLEYSDDNDNILSAAAGRWGKEGSNGGHCTFNATNQALKGNFTCDKISSVDINLKSGCSYTGAIDTENTGNCTLTLSSNAHWTLTGNCYLDSFTDENESYNNIDFNGYSIYLTDGTVISK